MSNKIRQRILLVAAGLVALAVVTILAVSGMKITDQKKVGLILTGSVNDSGWNGMHYSGAADACEKLNTRLIVKENISEGTGECAEAVKQLADDGADMIILSSYGYPTEIEDLIGSYPNIAFYGISSEYIDENMTSYFGRMYQARYLSGIIAGMKTETNSIGYVAAMPNNEVNRGINAFTLGVKSVNPEAQVYVRWTNSWDDAEKESSSAELLIREKNADVITCHQNQHNAIIAADEAGVYSIGYNQAADEQLSDKHLTAAVWNWDSLYYDIIKELTQGQPNSVKHRWFGLESGAVALSGYSPLVTEQEKQAVDDARNKILAGTDVFSGIIYDNNGTLRCDEGEILSDETLKTKMDWFVDGVTIYE